jgi:hypothetical protein
MEVRMRRVHPVVFGALTVALLDGLEPVIFVALRGGQPMRVFQSIAAGLLGRDAFTGGIRTVLLGMALHLFIASVVVVVYWLASRRIPALARKPFVYGPLYGLVVYAVMNFVVIPLSATGNGIRMPAPIALANGIFAHLFCVGIPTGLTARAAARRDAVSARSNANAPASP